ncbi:DUF1919 domain-containing protein [Leptobacterium flavescens]|uniref:DUF1919 domain-containing protein n=1 Tax=Leptobacterium flavescens TaxID=472055 RepID=A0A6P0UNP7_9FLAO|nr:DUF1919 domain-containing protein [Leptobacterium flavescens]NER13528.1 DUF1919 domain-containing protein [Leptobacterium flavescens]
MNMRKTAVYIKRKARQVFKPYLNNKDIIALEGKEFIIVSDNCWGGKVYQWFKRPYNSPFVGLFIHGPCYIKLLSNFEFYIRQELKFSDTTGYKGVEVNYPIGILHDIEIHFKHYSSEEEALMKWNRRVKRMLENDNPDDYFFKICDERRATPEIFQEFHSLPFKNKVSFSVQCHDSLRHKNHIVIKESSKNLGQHVPNGVKLFKLTFLYFDVPKWLKS